MKSKIGKMGLVLLVGIILLFVWIDYATKANPQFATYSVGFSNESVNSYDLINGAFDEKLIRISEYAELSNIVYRGKGKEAIDSFQGWSLIPISMGDVNPEDDSRKLLNGFYYELWELNETTETTVAIVFRGTNSISDWGANLRWGRRVFDKKTWDHYDQLNKISESIIDSINLRYSELENLKIVATGHSLGGGLAQFMAYASPVVNHVYAFDPSPVTGYYDVEPKVRRNENKRDATIYRIYESGEALSFVRKIMTVLYPVPLFKTKDPKIVRIRFSFSTGENSVGQHSMEVLSENIRNEKQNNNFE